MTTRRAGAVCHTVWRERTAQISWSGEEEEAYVHASVCSQYCSWSCLLCDSLCLALMMPSGSLSLLSTSLYVVVSQSCDERTHRDRKNLCGRAAVSPVGEKTHICLTAIKKTWLIYLWLNDLRSYSIYFCNCVVMIQYCRVTGLRWTTQLCQGLCPRSCVAKETSSLETCLRSIIFTAGKWLMTYIMHRV